MSFKNKFLNLGHPRRIWTVSAVHGELNRLRSLHQKIAAGFMPGDRLVYTGNYFCGGDARTSRPLQVMDELLAFRRALLAQPGVLAGDFNYLRGTQEELWSKLLQIQLAPSPRELVEWLQAKHPEIDQLLHTYGTSLDEVGRIAREGILSLTRWTSQLKDHVRHHPGHQTFFSVLRRAAFTELKNDNDNNILFVHAGLDPALPLTAQEGGFWWNYRGFNEIGTRYAPFRAIIRGHDPEQQGVHVGTVTVSLDGGAGRGGQLICARLSPLGEVMELIAA